MSKNPLPLSDSASVTPARLHFAINPDDNNDLAVQPKSIYCKVAGTIVIRDEAGTDLPYPMSAGDVLTFRGVRVLSAGTTGTYYGWL